MFFCRISENVRIMPTVWNEGSIGLTVSDEVFRSSVIIIRLISYSLKLDQYFPYWINRIFSILDKYNSFHTGWPYFPSLYTFILCIYVIIFRRRSFHKLSNEGYWNFYKRTNRNLDGINIDKFILLSWFDICQLLVLFMQLIGNDFLESLCSYWWITVFTVDREIKSYNHQFHLKNEIWFGNKSMH